jgi:hypothetical protein
VKRMLTYSMSVSVDGFIPSAGARDESDTAV